MMCTCIQCGNEFSSPSGASICSDACRKGRKLALDRERYKNNAERREAKRAQARARIPQKNERIKRLRAEAAIAAGRTPGKGGSQINYKKRAECEIMKAYHDEGRALRAIEDAVWRKPEMVAEMMRIRARNIYYSKTPEERSRLEKERRAKFIEAHGVDAMRKRKSEYKKAYIERAKRERPDDYRRMLRECSRRSRPKMMLNPKNRIKENMRKRFRDDRKLFLLTGKDSMSSLIGCTWTFFHAHIERQFKRGQTWENYGKVWHLDHIIPLAAFDLTDQAQRRKAWHYTNLQPLNAEENMRKSDSIITTQPELALQIA